MSHRRIHQNMPQQKRETCAQSTFAQQRRTARRVRQRFVERLLHPRSWLANNIRLCLCTFVGELFEPDDKTSCFTFPGVTSLRPKNAKMYDQLSIPKSRRVNMQNNFTNPLVSSKRKLDDQKRDNCSNDHRRNR